MLGGSRRKDDKMDGVQKSTRSAMIDQNEGQRTEGKSSFLPVLAGMRLGLELGKEQTWKGKQQGRPRSKLTCKRLEADRRHDGRPDDKAEEITASAFLLVWGKLSLCVSSPLETPDYHGQWRLRQRRKVK
jgi:hypothetical protein